MNLLTINNAIGILAQTRGLHNSRALGEQLAIVLEKHQDVKGRYSVDQFAEAMVDTDSHPLTPGERLAFEAVASAKNGE